MKVFLSSLISGMEGYRAAARHAAETLRHTVIAAEDFGASAMTPQQVCLQGVREADLVVLMLGDRYGAPQQSGLSATHEEYREARGTKPVLSFVLESASRESRQEQLIKEVSTWEGGGYRAPFDSPETLASAVTRALHEWELAQQAGPVDEDELVSRVAALMPERPRNMGGGPQLNIVVAGAPAQRILRPRDLDDPQLYRDIAREAVFGDHSVFDPHEGVHSPVVQGSALLVSQDNALVGLDEQGSVWITRSARGDDRRDGGLGVPSLIEEDVRDRVAHAISYAGWLLDRVDPTHRLSRVALASRIHGVGYMPWRTRAEAAASPNAASMGSGSEAAESPPVVLPRAALLFDTSDQADDIVVRLRRQILGQPH